MFPEIETQVNTTENFSKRNQTDKLIIYTDGRTDGQTL